MAEVQHKLQHDLIFGEGYPSFPRMESAFSRTGYEERKREELNIRVFRACSELCYNSAQMRIQEGQEALCLARLAVYVQRLIFYIRVTGLPTHWIARANLSCGALACRCGGPQACYFDFAAGLPAVLSKRFVFELIEDEDGLALLANGIGFPVFLISNAVISA